MRYRCHASLPLSFLPPAPAIYRRLQRRAVSSVSSVFFSSACIRALLRPPTIVARRKTIGGPEPPAEMRRIREAPGERDLADHSVPLCGHPPERAHALQAPVQNVAPDREPFPRQQVVGIAHADAGSAGHGRRLEGRIAKTALDHRLEAVKRDGALRGSVACWSASSESASAMRSSVCSASCDASAPSTASMREGSIERNPDTVPVNGRPRPSLVPTAPQLAQPRPRRPGGEASERQISYALGSSSRRDGADRGERNCHFRWRHSRSA